MTKTDKQPNYLIISVLLLIASTMTIMDDFTVSPVLPKITAAFQNTSHIELLSKMVLTMPALFITFCAPLAGLIMDKIGRKPVLLFSVALYVIAGTSVLYLNSIYQILISRAFMGIAVAGVITTCTTLIGDYFTGKSVDKLMGLQSSFIGFGGLVFLIAGGFLADISWRAPFYIYFLPVIYLIGIIFFIYEPEKKNPIINNTYISGKLPAKSLSAVYLTAFLLMVVFYMIPVQIPYYLGALKDITFGKIGIALSFMTLCTGITSIYYKNIKEKLNTEKIFALGFMLLGTAYIIISLKLNYYSVILGLMLVGTSTGLIVPNISTSVVSIVSTELRGRVTSGIFTSYYLGQFCSPIIIEPLIRTFNIQTSFAITGIITIIITGLSFKLLKIFNKENLKEDLILENAGE